LGRAVIEALTEALGLNLAVVAGLTIFIGVANLFRKGN
jgi:hypothetical protein